MLQKAHLRSFPILTSGQNKDQASLVRRLWLRMTITAEIGQTLQKYFDILSLKMESKAMKTIKTI